MIIFKGLLAWEYYDLHNEKQEGFQQNKVTASLTSSLHLFFQAGEAYFVSDDSPVNNFEFFRPLVSDSLGPKLRFM